MVNSFDSLEIDHSGDNSTNNLPRKLKKLKRIQEVSPTEERALKIKKIEEIVNPPKKIKRKNKKKKKIKAPVLDEEYNKHNSYWKKEERERNLYETRVIEQKYQLILYRNKIFSPTNFDKLILSELYNIKTGILKLSMLKCFEKYNVDYDLMIIIYELIKKNINKINNIKLLIEPELYGLLTKKQKLYKKSKTHRINYLLN
jgi:hypothetical protein